MREVFRSAQTFLRNRLGWAHQGSQPIQRSPWGLLVGDKVVGAELLMMQVPSGLRSFPSRTGCFPVLSFGPTPPAGSLLYPQSNLLSSVALRICTIDERPKLTNVLVEGRDTIEDNFERLIRKPVFECEGVAGKYVTSIVGAPKQKIVVTQI